MDEKDESGSAVLDREAVAPPAEARPAPPRKPPAAAAAPPRKTAAAAQAEDLEEIEEIEEIAEIEELAPEPAPKKAAAKPAAPAKAAAPAKPAKPAAKPATAEEEEGEEAVPDEDGDIEPSRRFRFRSWMRNSSAMIVSTVVHMAAIIVLAFIVIEPKAVEKIQEVIAEVLDEPEKNEELKVELENQLTEVTERTDQTFSTSMVVGAVGASGPQALVSAPTMDSALLTQAVNSDVSIEGINIDVPSSKKLIVEAPDGQIGEARAVVDSYQEAMDRITQELMWMLDKGPVLAIWAFDQSESMKDDQKEIRDRFEHVYDQLGLVTKSNEGALQTAVVSYGEGYAVHTRKPTHDRDDIRAAISEIPNDPSGKEMMCSTVRQAIATHRQYAASQNRQIALILVTDESGDRTDNDTMLEQAIAEAKSARCKIYVLGREAVFGYPYVHIRWIHPQTRGHHWIAIDRGPETAFVEQLQTDGFHRRYDAHPSGFGPYECTRMGRETGGIFFMLPSLETNLVHGTKRNYDMEAPYYPDMRSRMEVKADIDASRLRKTLEDVIYDLNPYVPEISKIIEMRVTFSRDIEPLTRQVRTEQAKAIVYLNYLAQREKQVEQLGRERRDEASPRWQANYDLLYAQLIAYQARMYEYGVYLEQFVQKPKIVPLTRPPNLTHTHWDIRTRKEILTKEAVPYIERASAMFQEIMSNHPSTPWAARAETELKRGFGVELIPDYDGPRPYIPPGTPIMPVPKM